MLLGVFLLAYFPVWERLFSAWASSDDYSHGFVIVPLACFILWQKRQELKAEANHGSWAGLILAVFSLLVYLLAWVGEIKTLASLSMIPFLAGTIWFFWGAGVLRRSLFPLTLLLLMIPVPSQILAAATIPLQLLVTEGAVGAGRLLGLPLLHQGNVIHLPSKTFEVVQACSGLRSIMTLVTLGVVLGYFTLKTNWQRGLLLFSSIPIAILVNAIRVFAMVALFHYYEIDLLEGTAHTLFGLGIFVLTLTLFFMVQRGLLLCTKAES